MQRRKDNKGRVLKDGEVYRKSDGLYMYRWTAKTENAIPSMMQPWRGCAKRKRRSSTIWQRASASRSAA